MNRKHLLALICLSLGLSALPSFAAKGVLPARYTDQQMADLAADLDTVFRSEYRIRYFNHNAGKVAAVDRQKELMGIGEDGGVGDMLVKLRNWWLTDGMIKFADVSKFELVHRADLFPPEEIVAKWELAPAADAPMPNRKPAQPGARPK